MLATMVEQDRCHVIDRGHTRFTLWNAIVAARPHDSYRGMKGPRCDGTLRIVTSRLDLPADLIAEMDRLRWTIEMFFRTFKPLLGCMHLFSTKHDGGEIQAYCAMIACMRSSLLRS